jgi:predicted DNA-binding protein
MRRAGHNFHVPLPDELYKRLREEAERSDQPATVLARDAIETWLRDREKLALHDAIAEYATRHGGTAVDIDEELEEASVEHLVAEEEKAVEAG